MIAKPDNNNTRHWDALRRPPKDALKPIQGKRGAKNLTNIDPQWRMQAMTEHFGPCGIGWRYTIDRVWTEPGHAGEVMAFAIVTVYIKDGDEWSEAVPGVGGNKLIEANKSGHYNNDEGFKMAVTDAMGVAMKSLGVAADIYAGAFDGSKYTSEPQSALPPAPVKITLDQIKAAFAELDEDSQADLMLSVREKANAKTLDELDPSTYPNVLAGIQKRKATVTA